MTIKQNRRDLLALAAAASSTAAFSGIASAMGQTPKKQSSGMPPLPKDAPTVAMFIYPKMVALDLVGPMTVFNLMRFKIELFGKTLDPVGTDLRVPFPPTHDFSTVTQAPDILFIPGGIFGTIDCIKDEAVCEKIAEVGNAAKWVTSVCTGSLVLGASGLLDGYKATSHWGVTDLLPVFGATHENERVVRDRNRITGGGVTAGIDFGLEIASMIKDEETARWAQLIIEYSPQPPFKNGTPEEAGEERYAYARNRRKRIDAAARNAAVQAAERLEL